MKNCLFILLLSIPLGCLAQFTISGKVINSSDKKPVSNASVFLNNATVGSRTADDGSFTLTNVRSGQYDMVVSIVGFETAHQTVMVTADIKLPVTEIAPKVMMLDEVKIKPNADFERNYAMFKKLFFGSSPYADKCKIMNADVLDIDYNAATRTLTAKSYDYMEIENDALGYKIKYMLADFKNDYSTGYLYFEGTAAFTALKGSKKQQSKWAKNRLRSYEGSSMHFLRSTIANSLPDEGFKALRLIRKPNPTYKGGFDNKYIQSLVTTPLAPVEFAHLTDIKGEYALSFKDCLYIMYDKKKSRKSKENTIINVPEYLNDPDVTILSFDEPYAFYDDNGIILNPRVLKVEGNWGSRLMAELLPVDYVPEAKGM